MYVIKDGCSHSFITTPLSEKRLEFNDILGCIQYANMECRYRRASMYVYRLILSNRGFTIGSEIVYTIHHPNQNLEILFPWNNVNN